MAKVDQKNDIQSIAADQGLNYSQLKIAIDRIKQGMFFMYFRHNAKEDYQKEFNETLKTVFKKTYGVEFDESFASTNRITPVALMGPPGHGKTTAFKVAAKWFAKETGLKYIDKFNLEDYASGKEVLSRDSMVFVSQEFSGEVSKAGIGLPFKSVSQLTVDDEMIQVEAMQNMMPKRFQIMRQAKAAVLLLDDFVNASPAIQNIALSITNENRFQDMDYSNVYIGVTGNLGAIDGTHTSKMSSALNNRLEVLVVSDSAGDFANRLIERTKDKYGDLGLSGFLRRNPDFFWQMPSKGAFASPRSWDGAIDAMRVSVLTYGSLEKALSQIRGYLPSYLGATNAEHVSSYLHQMTIGASPLAEKMINHGKWDEQDEKKFEKGYKEGFSGDALDFAFQFSTAMADFAAQNITTSPKHKELEDLYAKINAKAELSPTEKKSLKEAQYEILKEPIERFILGMSRCMQQEALAFGVQQLSDKLAYQLPAWSQEQSVDDRIEKSVKFEIKELITQITAELVRKEEKSDKKEKSNINHNNIMVVIDAITAHDQMMKGPPVKLKARKSA